MTNPKPLKDSPENTDFTGLHLSEITDTWLAPGDEEEIVNEQEQNEVVNEEEENQTTNSTGS